MNRNAPQRIVVVNDDPVQLEAVAGFLEGRGYDVRRFFTADAALHAMTADRAPDLIVTDLHMPGIDGWKFCRLLRSPDFASLGQVPIMVMSATFSGAEVESLTAELGADAFLPSPSPPDTLVAYVEQLLAGERPRATPGILIVDDDEALRKLLRRHFEANGWQVLEASTGGEAIRLYEGHRPAVVLLDYHLPDVPGSELLSALRRPAESAVVIIMTGDTNPRLPVGLMRQGADGYVRKPFECQYVLDLVAAAQRERSLLRVEDILESRTQELRASEARYRVLFGSIPEGILIVDDSGRVLQSNTVVQRWLATSEDDLLGVGIRDLVPTDQRRAFMDGIQHVLGQGSGELSLSLTPSVGEPLACDITLRALVFQGSPAVLCVCRDVTARNRATAERRALEARIQQAQKLESLGVLAGGVAHDFNNLLVGILGNASLAAMDLHPGGPAWDSIKQIEVAARRAAELTAQILTYTGKARISSEVLDLTDMVREMAQLLEPAVASRAEVDFDLHVDPVVLKGDPAQLRQVVMNLLMNASDALEGEPGQITVRTGVLEAGRAYLDQGYLGDDAMPGSFVYLEVQDTGCGMDDATRDRMFDPFFTTKLSGRGLGLAATLGVVKGHGGAIHVSSALGRGTVFRVMFPAVEAALPGPEPEVDAPPASSARASEDILVVDDEDSVRNVAASVLKRFGYRVIQASGGEEALEILAGDRHSIRAVVLDLTMPGVDGREVLKFMAIKSWDVPVVLSSGYTEDAVREEVRGHRVAGFVRKPYSPNELLQKVQRAVQSAPDRRRLAGRGSTT